MLFLTKNRLKKHAVPSIKYRYVLKKSSFYYKGFSLIIGLKSHVLFIFLNEKTSKTLNVTNITINRYVLEKLSFYYKGLSLKIGLKSHVLCYF